MQNAKRTISLLLVLCMLLSVLPVSALAVDIWDKPENGTTVGQPFPVGAGGSNNFRIPGIVTLEDGTIVAACDARWNHTGDGAGLDTIVAVSHDNGENWTHTFANYLGDNGNTYNNLSTCIIDPAIGTDGETVYLIADLFPAGIALNTSKYAPVSDENGFDAEGHLLLRALADDTIAIGYNGYNSMAGEVSRYQYYLDLEDLTLHNADGSAIEGYTVDPWFNITGNGVDTNLFFSDSPYQPYPTDYLYLVKSTDGLEWSEPELLNLQEDGEQTLLIGPGNGTYDAESGRMIFTAYEYTNGYQRTSLLWMDAEGNWKRTADATGYYNWSSEATSVVLADGTVRCFYRDGFNYLRYTDYLWDESSQNYVPDSSAYEVGTVATKTNNNQISSIKYSEQIDGKDVILVSTANSDGRNRRNGTLYTFLVNEDKSMELAYAYDIFEGTDDYYAYSCISEMAGGNIALLYEGDDGGSGYGRVIFKELAIDEVTARDNDVRLSFVDIELLTGDTYTYTDSTGYYGDADLSELDTSVATVELTGEETTTNAAMVLSNGATVDLDSCQYTFTASGEYYHISAEVDGTTVYLNHYSSTGNNIPNITSPAGEIAVLPGSVEGMFQLKAQVIEGSGSGVARSLHFHAEASTPYWNRCGNDTSYKCHEYLYRKAAEGETASTEIPGYIRLTSVDQVVDGGKYLIAAKNDAGNWYVLNPAASSTSLDHVAQVMGVSTVGWTELTFTGVGAGYTEVQIGSTVYRITVADVSEVAVEIPVGGSATFTEPNGNYSDSDTSALDTSVATVVLTGMDGTNSSGVALAPASELTDGTYLIVNTRASKVVNNISASESAAAGSMAGLKLQGTTASFDAATAVWTFTAVDGGYTIQDQNGKYMSIARNSAGVLDEAHTIHVERNGSTWVLEENNAYLNDAAGMGTTASGWEDPSSRNDSGSQFSLYAYSVTPGGPSTEVTFTGVYPGSTELLVGRTRYLITVTGEVVDVDLNVGESESFLVDGDPDLITVPDEDIVTTGFHVAEVGHLGTDASYTGAFVDLTDALFTFTENEDGTYVVSNGDVYLEGYASNNGYPVVDYSTNITIGDGFTDYSVTLYSTSVAAERSGYLFFWRDGKNYFDRVTSTGGFESGVSFHLYEQMDDGSFTMIAGKADIVSGNRYLIVADAGDHGLFVTWPTTDRTTRYSQIAKFGTGTRITFTGVAAGETTLVIPGAIYEITVTGETHEHSYEAVVTAPTCTENGYTTYTCSCGDSYVADEVEALGHDYEIVVTEPTCTTEGYSTYTCTRCDHSFVDDVKPALGHSFGDWSVTTKPTCTEAGVETRSCACGETETREIPAAGHTEEVLPAVEATCTETGLTEGKKCSVCGEILVAQEVIPALGHDFVNGDCSRCDAVKDAPFVDVPVGSFFFDPVEWAVEKGITTGTDAEHFDPYASCNRAQVVTFLWRAAGSPEPTKTDNPFTDVTEGDFFYKAVLWAVENNITNGISADKFGPFSLCNRAQVVTFLWRAQGEPAPASTENPFGDVDAGAWYGPAVLWAVENGVTNGMTADQFGVTAICNRAQVVTFLYRAMAK